MQSMDGAEGIFFKGLLRAKVSASSHLLKSGCAHVVHLRVQCTRKHICLGDRS